MGRSLEGFGAGLAGPDADHMFEFEDENLAVADFAGAGGFSMASMTWSISSSATAASTFTLGENRPRTRPR